MNNREIKVTVFLPDGYCLEIGERKYRTLNGTRVLARAKRFIGPWPKFAGNCLRLPCNRHAY